MTSPLRRASHRPHLALVGPSPGIPRNEGFLISGNTTKADAVIDFTVRGHPKAVGRRKIIVVPGYGGIKPAYGGFRDASAEAIQDDAVSYRQPRTQKSLKPSQRADAMLHPDKLGKQSVVGMIDMMWELFGVKVTLVGHSMGGPNAIEGALRRPDRVAEVVLLGSGGLEEGQNLLRLTKRLPQIVTREGRSILAMPRENAVSMFGQSAFHIARNPLRTLGEGLDIAHRDIMVDEINQLRARDIGVHAVQLENDGFFPTEIAERDTRGLVDTFTVIEGANHVAPQTHPDIVAGHIAHVLETGRPNFESLDSAHASGL